jgi:histidine ammonia-lyase
LNSGFQMAQVTSAALVAENRALSHPCSVDSIPTSAGQEDHVSMATHAARRLRLMAANAGYVVAIELMAAAQGADLRGPDGLAAGTRHVYEQVRSLSGYLEQDRIIAGEIETVSALVSSGSLSQHVRLLLGDLVDPLGA